MKLACLTPLPPVKSGIAAYSLMLFRELGKLCDLTAVVSQDEVSESAGVPVLPFEEFVKRRSEFDAVVCQLGNNPHHEAFYRYALEHPSVVVLHDLVLHHLIVEMTLARGDVNGYVEALFENHGEAGAAWARGRAAGLHDEIGNFLFPASVQVANRARHLIVHNDYARDTLLRFGVATPITVTGHPLPPIGDALAARGETRAALGFSESDVVVAMFGFVTAAKRPERVFEAFARAAASCDGLRLLVVGEPAPNVSLQRLADNVQLAPELWKTTGYVSDDEFSRYLAAADRVVNLRYPSAGETSGPLVHALAAGKPVAVSDYGPFASIPRGVVTHVPLGDGEIDALAAFMTAPEAADGSPQREWIVSVSDTAAIARDYIAAASGVTPEASVGIAREIPLPLFATWKMERLTIEKGRATAQLRNAGSTTIRNPLFGQPASRIIVKCDDGSRLSDAWVRTNADVAPGEVTTIVFEVPSGTRSVSLISALEGIDIIDAVPFSVTELV